MQDSRFSHIHIDLVGPLPISNGYRYLLTCVCRFSHWMEAEPLKDGSSESVITGLLYAWISRYGVPSRITTDRGAQFARSHLFQKFIKQFGICHNQTTSYHPQANGMVERSHRQLKAALKCRELPRDWWGNLPIIMLGIRTTLKEDLGCSTAELCYGTVLRVPGEFWHADVCQAKGPGIGDFSDKLSLLMSELSPVQPRHSLSRPVYISQDLDKCTYVFLRTDAVKTSLQAPYEGPFRVVDRNLKKFKLIIKGKEVICTIDRCKPAYLEGTGEPDYNLSGPTDFEMYQKGVASRERGRRINLPLRFRE